MLLTVSIKNYSLVPAKRQKEGTDKNIINEPHREKTGLLPMRKQRRRSASQ